LKRYVFYVDTGNTGDLSPEAKARIEKIRSKYKNKEVDFNRFGVEITTRFSKEALVGMIAMLVDMMKEKEEDERERRRCKKTS
jgi:hypothetical protein